jgi:hypothetical protein
MQKKQISPTAVYSDFDIVLPFHQFIVKQEPPTLLVSSDKTFSKVPNGIATDVGIPTHEGTFPFRYAMLRDFAPTWQQKCEHSKTSARQKQKESNRATICFLIQSEK